MANRIEYFQFLLNSIEITKDSNKTGMNLKKFESELSAQKKLKVAKFKKVKTIEYPINSSKKY